MWQSDGEPAWQDKTYTARKDKKTLDRNKQGSNLVGVDEWVTDLFFEENITVVGCGGLAGVVGVGHHGYA